MELQKAKRHQVKLRVGLSGPSGFGKSYSALLLAYGMTNDWSKIAIIDTENNSANLYAHLGDFNVLSLGKPFSPERYIKAIEACEKANMEVVIIDSITHEWSGKGGCLEIHDKLGGRFQDWAKVTPRHNAFIDKIINSKTHIITTVRRKIDYSLDSNMGDKTRVIKHGTKEVTREGYEYELTVNFELINDKHLAKASKDRTGLFMDKPEFVINTSTGKKLIDWCSEGISVSEVSEEIDQCKTLEELRRVYKKYSGLKSEIQPLLVEKKNEIEQIVEHTQTVK